MRRHLILGAGIARALALALPAAATARLKPDDIVVVDRDADPAGVDGRPGAVFKVDPDSGAVSVLAASPLFRNPSGVAFDARGRVVVRNRKNGIAFLIDFGPGPGPGPGEVGLAGKGIVNRGLVATTTKSIATDGGRLKLKIKPAKNGKKARRLCARLERKGKAKLKVRVSYQPTGGTINTRGKKVKLVRK